MVNIIVFLTSLTILISIVSLLTIWGLKELLAKNKFFFLLVAISLLVIRLLAQTSPVKR